MTARLEARDGGDFMIHGDLDFRSVATLWEDSDRLFLAKSPLRVNLADVKRCDSSGVALLVDWLRQARARDQELKFVNIPAQMQAIIRVTDLEELLPFE